MVEITGGRLDEGAGAVEDVGSGGGVEGRDVGAEGEVVGDNDGRVDAGVEGGVEGAGVQPVTIKRLIRKIVKSMAGIFGICAPSGKSKLRFNDASVN